MTLTLRDRLTTLVVCGALAAVTFGAYWPVTRFGFVEWDDPGHVRDRPEVNSGLTWNNFVWSWGIHGPSQWHPLAWWSHQLDCQIYGVDEKTGAPRGHHLSNLLFHAAAAVVLLLALKRLTGALWPSALVAALFALHPLSVESVAWIAERRDVLSALFWALTLWAYAAYAQRGGWARYALVVLFFVLGLMAKPMLVTLPCVLLLLDYWPLRRFTGRLALSEDDVTFAPGALPSPPRSLALLIAEKIPLLLLAVVSVVLSFLCQQKADAINSLKAVPFSLRLSNAAMSYLLYLRNMVWPLNLSPMYPLKMKPDYAAAGGAAVLLLLITLVTLWQWRRRPWLIVGWLWFLGTLVPVIGLLRMGVEVSMADRWVYLPMIGIYLAVVWSMRELLGGRREAHFVAAVASLAVLTVCIVLTRRQVEFWKNSKALFSRALAMDPDVPLAHLNLGTEYEKEGALRQAAQHYIEAMRVRIKMGGEYPEAHNNLGKVFGQMGYPEKEFEEYRIALRLDPKLPRAHYNLGTVLRQRGQTREAATEFREALRLDAEQPEVWQSLGVVLQDLGESSEAAQALRHSIQLQPASAGAHNSLGVALKNLGQTAAAIEEFQTALKLEPQNSAAHYNLGRALVSLGQSGPAIEQFRLAIKYAGLSGDANDAAGSAAAHVELGKLLSERHEFEAAMDELSEAVRLRPGVADYHNLFGASLATLNRFKEAADQFRAALAIDPNNGAAQRNLQQAEAILRQQP